MKNKIKEILFSPARVFLLLFFVAINSSAISLPSFESYNNQRDSNYLIQINKDINLPILSAQYQNGSLQEKIEIDIEKDTVFTFFEETETTITLGLDTDENSPDIPFEVVILKSELRKADYEILEDSFFDESSNPDDPNAIATLDEILGSEFDSSLVAGTSYLKKRKSSRLGSVCKMKRGRGGRLYKQCYCYRFVKAEMRRAGVNLSGGHARNAYSQMAHRKGWHRIGGVRSAKIGDMCVWGGKGSGHVAVRKACGWYWGKCTGPSQRPLLGCFSRR